MNFISFLLGFSSAVTSYIISSYFQAVRGSDNISIFYFLSNLILLIFLLNFHKLVRAFGKSFIYIASSFLLAISSLVVFMLPTSWAGAFAVLFNIIIFGLSYVSHDIVLESYSTDVMSGRIRGFNSTILNAGFLVGPFLAMTILDRFNFQGVFLFQFVLVFLIFLIAFFNLKKVNHKFKPVVTVNGLLRKIFIRKNILRIYYISFLLDVFIFVMIVYMPIYLRNLGMDWSKIGIIFTIMLLPFVIFQYPAGRLADKKMGEKELIIFSLFIMGVSVFSIYFIGSTSLYVWSIVLFITRIGAALLEILRDSYFYKRIDGADVDIINFFRTARPVGFLAASALSAVMLLFFPLNSIFILLAIIIFTGFYPALKLKDNLGEEEVMENNNKK
jgi:MFS family permease